MDDKICSQQEFEAQVAREAERNKNNQSYVDVHPESVVVIAMPSFGWMIEFMLKWVLASIPAGIVLAIIFAVMNLMLCSGVMGLGHLLR